MAFTHVLRDAASAPAPPPTPPPAAAPPSGMSLLPFTHLLRDGTAPAPAPGPAPAPSSPATPWRASRPPPPPVASAADRAAREAHIVPADELPSLGTARLGDAPAPPSAWFFDWSRTSPLDAPGVLSWLRRKLQRVVLPAGWLDASAGGDVPAAPSIWDLDPLVGALDQAFEQMLVGARSAATLANYRNPFLKLVLWVALHGGAVAPPEPWDVRRYLVYVVALRRNQSVAEQAVRAVQFVCWSNDWPVLSSSPHCRVPVQAAVRAFGRPTVKAAPVEPWMVVAVVQGSASAPLAQRMVAWAVLACFMCLGRYSDLCRLRFDSGYYEDHGSFLRFFLDKRKTDQNYDGQWIDVASSSVAASAFGGFSAVVHLRAAAAALQHTGPVLRRVGGPAGREYLRAPLIRSGSSAGCLANMSRDTFQKRYQALLIRHCGLSETDAKEYSSHGIRAGAATTLVKHKVPEHIIKACAGVTSAGWIDCYDRLDLDRRLECSRALGL